MMEKFKIDIELMRIKRKFNFHIRINSAATTHIRKDIHKTSENLSPSQFVKK